MVRVPVNRIIPFSSVDGPGSRTAVFLQECNVDCRYCHNPETRNLCTGCRECVRVCPAHALAYEQGQGGMSGRVLYYPEKCVFCDTCIRTCHYGSSPRIRQMNAAEVFSEVARQIPFIRGITVSGGECMLHPDFLTELFAVCKKHMLHTLIDSNGTIPFMPFTELLTVTDGVMLDVKAYAEDEHRKVTGAGNKTVLENAIFLAEAGKLYEVRTVVADGLFDAEDTVRRTVRLLAGCSCGGVSALDTVRYKLITYRENGVREQYRIYQPPAPERMEYLAEAAKEEGIKQVMIV